MRTLGNYTLADEPGKNSTHHSPAPVSSSIKKFSLVVGDVSRIFTSLRTVIEDALVNAVGLLLVSSDDRRSFNDALARWPDGSSFNLAWCIVV